MEIAKLDGLELAYADEGEGEPVLLVHGFASTGAINWKGPGWIEPLTQAGYRVIYFDNRGHGKSTKFYDEEAYSLETMAEDAHALLEYLGVSKANVMGYSMGARISAMLAYLHPEKVERLILAGSGYNMVDGGFPSSLIRDGLLAESLDDVDNEMGKAFRFFAEQTGSDREALAACIMGVRSPIEQELFSQIKPKTLVTIGTEDDIAQNGEKLASIIPDASFMPIPKRNHMNAVGDKVYKENVMGFLNAD